MESYPVGSPRYDRAAAYIEGFHRFGMRLGLSRLNRLLSHLGDPHLGLQVVHVAGTNGKGSTAALIASIAGEAGYRTALFTSPHLESYTERFVVDGLAISPECFADLAEEIRPVVERMEADGEDSPTAFELLTAMACLEFLRRRVDLAVMEVGLGGRLDGTNVFPRPLAAALTSIDLDHTQVLGNSVGRIAAEKCGVIHPGEPVVTTAVNPEALRVIRKTCRRSGGLLWELGRQFSASRSSWSLAGQEFSLRTPGRTYDKLEIPLPGPHQTDNAAGAAALAEILEGNGFRVPPEAVAAGLRRARWPGRFEVFSTAPLAVLDGAHNPGGMSALRRTIEELWGERSRPVLLLGMLEDKDIPGALQVILPAVRALVVTEPPVPRRAGCAEVAALAARIAPGLDVRYESLVDDAVAAALSLASRDGPAGSIVICGSLFLLAPARKALERMVKTRVPLLSGQLVCPGRKDPPGT